MKKIYLFFLVMLSFAIGSSEKLNAQTNQYLHFDRVDDYVEVPNASGYIANSSEISYAGWFYTDELAYGQGMMSIRGGGSGTGEMYVIQLDNGLLECRLITTAGFHEVVAPAFSIVPETWQHIAWVYDGSEVRLYIDGNMMGSTPASGTITATNKPFTIGHCLLAGLNFVYGGRADEVSLWSKALTEQEVQDMMDNELTGDEAGLELYYKFNQGAPGEDNTSITKLLSETGIGDRDGNLLNFDMNGENSNFNGELDVSFQAITFPLIPTKLVTDEPFQLMASASSGLPVSYEIVSGPGTLDGDILTLDGTPGQILVKASQAGGGTFDPAIDVTAAINVVDPQLNVPFIDIRSPLAGDVFVSEPKPIRLAAISNIEFSDLFEVTDVKFAIDGEEVFLEDWNNEHYTGWWTPPSLGTFTVDVIATNNFGAAATQTITINVTDQAEDITVRAVEQAWLDLSSPMLEFEAELPSYLGAYDEILGNLIIECPTGGCDPWDRISGLEVKTHNGEWIEIIRYITPYGVACDSDIDLTDFMSALQGKIRFRVYLGTFGNGFLYTLDLTYNEGTPDYPYSSVRELWRETYDFGDPSNPQPCETINAQFQQNTEAAKIKLVSTGHGWGDNNTSNAAEFLENTHHIWVDGAETFEQNNWEACNPNPDGCQPQNGTWFFDRAGWCPGTIADWFDFDMTSYINQGQVELDYIFDESYTDLCHPNNSSCVSGVTCENCDDGFNPHLIVASYLISQGTEPISEEFVNTRPSLVQAEGLFTVYPNPSAGHFNLELEVPTTTLEVNIYNSLGQTVHVIQEEGSVSSARPLDLTHLSGGVYTVEVITEKVRAARRVIIEK